jgi:hypothetical protein
MAIAPGAELTLKLPILHSAQQRIIDEARRFNVLACGRRFGKDVLGQDVLMDKAIDGQPVAWFAPTYRMMLDNMRDIGRTCRDIASKINNSEHRIELITGGVIDFWSLDVPDVARGRHYARVIVNEAAMVRGLVDVWTRVIRPTLADLGGDAWFLSTPRGYNDFHALYSMAADHPDEWRSWRFPTSDNPHIPAREIDAMRAEMDAVSYAQEILAEFRSITGLVYQDFNEANITDAEPDLSQPFEVGFDDGYIDPRVFLLIQRTATGVLVFDEIAHSKRLDEESIRDLLELCARMYGKALPDGWPTMTNTARSAWCVSVGVKLPELAVGSTEAVQLMRRFREANIPARGGTHHIVDGIKIVRQLILDGNGVRSLMVNRRCKGLINEMTNTYRYPDGVRRDSEKPEDGGDHSCDAMRYWVHMRSGRR